MLMIISFLIFLLGLEIVQSVKAVRLKKYEVEKIKIENKSFDK